MKTRIILFAVLLLASFGMQAQSTYPLYSVRDIQFVHPDSLARGNDRSPRVGDTVRVLGAVVVRPTIHRDTNRVIMWAGARWQSYIRDTNYAQTEYTSLNIIQDDTTASSTNIMGCDTAKYYIFTGIVNEFGKQTQLNLIKTFPIQLRGSKPTRPTPLEVTINDFADGTAPKLINGEKWEGAYVVMRNVFSTDRTTSTSAANPFAIIDPNGNKISVHGQSGWFTKRNYALRTWDPPTDGSAIKMIRGVMGQNTDGSWVIRPMYPDDIEIGIVPPIISSIRRDKAMTTPLQPVVVTAKVKEFNVGGTVTSVKLKYRVNGGTTMEIPMTAQNDTTYQCTIPGVAGDSSLVDYYIWATNNLGLSGTNPTDSVRNKYFYFSMTRQNLRIQDVQYSPFGGGFSAFQGFQATVTGVVTADVTDIEGDGGSVSRRAYIQNGPGPWSGIQLFGQAIDALQRGQNVTITGWVNRTGSNTRLDTVTVVLNSSGNPLPAAVPISTRDIAAVSAGTVTARQYEGVLIKYRNVTVTRENSDGNPGPGVTGSSNFGEMNVADTSNISTRVELQEGNHRYHNMWVAGLDTIIGNIRVRGGDKFTELTGIPYYSFSNYKIVPRRDFDFVGYTSDAKDNEMQKASYSLAQNYPNPFNPATTIEYTIPAAARVTMKIYNVLGQEVRTLIDLDQNAGTYKVVFDASKLTSGLYLYTITAGDYHATKKMLLVR